MFWYGNLFCTFLFSLKILYTTTKICYQTFKNISLLLNIGIDLIISWPQKTWKKFSIKSIIKSKITFFFRMTSGKVELFLNWIWFFFFNFCYTCFLSMVKILQEFVVLQNHNANMLILLLILESYYVHIIRRISKS